MLEPKHIAFTKITNTIKYLISVAPAGAFSFISKGRDRKVLYKETTVNSG